tara:strand:+ start:1246 stop:1956 length:711 start_codon:yes stop_codon:yes gene_type:complete
LEFTLSNLAINSEQLLRDALNHPDPSTLLIVFIGGLLTGLGPCSISLLPITVAYLGGFQDQQKPFIRSINFCTGIIISFIILGSISGLLGKVFGQVPLFLPKLVALICILMGLNLIGFLKFPLPEGPNPENWRKYVPQPLAPMAAGLAFGLASSPCTTPVLAVLLAWIANTGNPFLGVLFLSVFGLGQVGPLIFAGTAAATIPTFLSFRPLVQWIPIMSGTFFLSIGLLTLLSEWI